MELGRFTEALAPAEVVAFAPVDVTDLAYDAARSSRLALLLRPGTRADGHDLAAHAVANGRSRSSASGRSTCRCRSSSSRASARAMGPAAALFFGDPSASCGRGDHRHGRQDDDGLPLWEILARRRPEPGLVGSIERRVGVERRPVALNTPEAIDLQRLLARWSTRATTPACSRRPRSRRRRGGSRASASRCSSSRT